MINCLYLFITYLAALSLSWGTWDLSLWHRGFSLVVRRFSCPRACGILGPWPGIKPTSPALEGIFLTTGPPGKLPLAIFIQKQEMIHRIGESFEKAKRGSFPPKKGIATNLRDPARECLLTQKKRLSRGYPTSQLWCFCKTYYSAFVSFSEKHLYWNLVVSVLKSEKHWAIKGRFLSKFLECDTHGTLEVYERESTKVKTTKTWLEISQFCQELAL